MRGPARTARATANMTAAIAVRPARADGPTPATHSSGARNSTRGRLPAPWSRASFERQRISAHWGAQLGRGREARPAANVPSAAHAKLGFTTCNGRQQENGPSVAGIRTPTRRKSLRFCSRSESAPNIGCPIMPDKGPATDYHEPTAPAVSCPSGAQSGPARRMKPICFGFTLYRSTNSGVPKTVCNAHAN